MELSVFSTITKTEDRSLQACEQQFEAKMRHTYKQAYNLAMRLTGNSVDAEDLIQESYIRAFRFFHRYDDSLPFTSWLYRIITNVHIDMVRRKGRIRTLSLESSSTEGTGGWDLPDKTATPEQTIVDEHMDGPIQRALLKLSPDFRAAVLLADVEGMAYEEIAQVMETSIGTVRSRIHRGRKQLRNLLVKSDPKRYGGMLS